jgi:hypothetical protein
LPLTALAAPALGLLVCDQPVALDRARVDEQGAVGRIDRVDEADAGQKSELAALPVSVPSGPIRR